MAQNTLEKIRSGTKNFGSKSKNFLQSREAKSRLQQIRIRRSAGESFRAIGRVFGLSRQRIHQIYREAGYTN